MRSPPSAYIAAIVLCIVSHMIVTAVLLAILINETRQTRAAHLKAQVHFADLFDQQDRRLSAAHDTIAHLDGIAQALRMGQQSNGIHTATLGQWVREIYETCWFLPPADRSVGVATVPR